MSKLYKPFLRIYKELENSEDIAQDFLFVGPKIKSDLSSAQGLLFGSLYFCFIDNCVKNLDIPQIKQAQDFFKVLLAQQNDLIENEKNQIDKIFYQINQILKSLKIFEGCSKCKKCENLETCEKFSDINEICKSLSNLENLFTQKQKQDKENYKFNEYFEFCASLALMEKLVSYSQANNLPNEEFLRKHNIIFNQIEQNDFFTAQMKSAFNQICEILQISCTFYYEFNQSLIKISQHQSVSKQDLHITYNYNIIFSQDYSSFRFGYSTTKINEQNMLKDKMYSQNDIIQILKQTEKTCLNNKEFPLIKQKLQDEEDLKNNKQYYLHQIKSLLEQQNEYAPTLKIWIDYINDERKRKYELECEIQQMQIDLKYQ
ncbi:hypothetical protein TTHERM_00483600 (macronuclear) [Tetrahymena thermophila SB210]|uniref:Uncharacterized protein n=1 Tax=Tetrahymena thermophila (strain SB210) TaxID=312017 RepID=I7M860_TETTS|nr:hypothetical protein TTHERM_00483600 [Tetrahymena thermophila SB210]EAR97228.1 hypothetical protein TTHERM_00483600 [Tetrahymena thermophila SB210]|eukprot:XP_001017473.1 hypothetical protein TTHERM_00483600 [Tetrahymena thermophila SB210]